MLLATVNTARTINYQYELNCRQSANSIQTISKKCDNTVSMANKTFELIPINNLHNPLCE